MLVSKKTLSFMKLLSGPCLWLNPDGPFLHKGLHPFHTVLIFLVMMNHVLQMISYKLSQSSVSFLTHNPSHMEKAFVQGKGKVSFHGNLLLFTYYVQNDNFFILARQTKKVVNQGYVCTSSRFCLPRRCPTSYLCERRLKATSFSAGLWSLETISVLHW